MMSFKPKNNVDDSQVEAPEDWSNSDTILVIDGDELCFVMSAACEQTSLIYTNTTNNFSHAFKNKTEFAKFTAGLAIPEDFFTSESKKVAEPVAIALSQIKRRLYKLQSKFKTNKVEIYLSGEGNYRDDLPLPKHNDPDKSGRYKGNRDPSAKPLLYNEAKQYLIKYWNAIVINGMEADDALCSRVWTGYKTGQKIIGLTQDKDSDGNLGWWYDYTNDEELKGEPVYNDGLGKVWLDEVSNKNPKYVGQGRKWLYWQWIVGDSSDNYDPRDVAKQLGIKLKRFGESTAFKLLNELETDTDCIKAVHDLYWSWYGSNKFTYVTWDDKEREVDYIDIMQLYWDCAKMIRFEGDYTDIRSMLKKLRIIE
jgi:5'-3' exonuclease